MCGKLRVRLYGTRDAAKNWEDQFGSKLVAMVFEQGRTSPCVHALKTKRLVAAVHDVNLKIQEVSVVFEIKKQVMGLAHLGWRNRSKS